MATILVIDDVPVIRKFLSNILGRSGYDVAQAIDGDDGVSQYVESPFDLVITDIVMPIKDGIQTIRELKSKFPDVKIIAISGGDASGSRDLLALARLAGAEYTFEKPVQEETLLDAVKTMLS